MPRKPDLNIEDVSFHDWESTYDKLEVSLSSRVFKGLTIVLIIVFVVFFGRVISLNIGKGEFYQARAIANVNKDIDAPTSRGIITDRFGESLVENIPTFSLSLNMADFFRDSESVIKNLKKVAGIIEVPASELEKMVKEVNLERVSEVILDPDITVEQAVKLRSLKLEAFRVNNAFRRYYPDKKIFSHVLGYVGVADEGDQIIGKTGLEAFYDDLLKGQVGKRTIYRDVKGKTLDEKVIAKAKPGFQLNTTIDAGLQRFFYKRFKEQLNHLNRTSGVGIAINPQNGEILSLINFPSFDNNEPAKYLNSHNLPLFNRAVSGVYSPGSTIKPFVALAALNEKVVTPVDEFYSKGYLELPNPYHPDKPSIFLDWKAHGSVNMFSALARSSNVYFYIVGGGFAETKGLGIDRLQKYWKMFHLGKKTGIDIPAEKVGFFYTPEEKEEKTGDIWRIGDTYNVSIGQGNLAMTPLRLISSIATLANNGKEYRPYIAKSIVDERSNIAQLNIKKKVLDYSKLEPIIYEVKKGLRDAVSKPYGTARWLADLPFKASGKTGSAQFANNTKTNAFFVGYAPSDNPEIAIIVLIENAREGSINTLPIAKDTLWWYYMNRIASKKNE